MGYAGGFSPPIAAADLKLFVGFVGTERIALQRVMGPYATRHASNPVEDRSLRSTEI